MNTHNVLIGALVVQAGLVALTWWPSPPPDYTTIPLIEGGGHSITALEISGRGADAPSVSLSATNGIWHIDSEQGYPADPDKVAEVIDALAGIALRSPIATHATSHASLGVDDDGFDKHITVTADGKTRGARIHAAASKTVHLRLDDSDDVYQVSGLSSFTLKDTAKGYLPANYVSVPVDDVDTLAITNAHGTIAFERGEDGWEVDSATPMAAKADAVDALVSALGKLRLSKVVGAPGSGAYGLDAGAVQIAWSTTDGEQTLSDILTVGGTSDSDRYAKAGSSDFVVTMPTYSVQPFLDADPAALAIALTPDDGAVPTDGTP